MGHFSKFIQTIYFLGKNRGKGAVLGLLTNIICLKIKIYLKDLKENKRFMDIEPTMVTWPLPSARS